MKKRLDQLMTEAGLVPTRSQAESFIKLGQVRVNGTILTKPGTIVSEDADIRLIAKVQYVSRAGLKLASVARVLKLQFKDKIVLDVGSSTGGFTDFALKNGAAKVIAVDVGTNQLHPTLVGHPQIELHEQTDIRDYVRGLSSHKEGGVGERPDIIVMDVSFISLREILPYVAKISGPNTQIAAMCKPQFEIIAELQRPSRLDAEAVFSSRNGGGSIDDTLPEYHRGKTALGAKSTGRASGSAARQVREARRSLHKGVIKNDKIRRAILKDFETWLNQYFIIIDKANSEVAGAKGNRERFYLLKLLG